MANTGRPTKLNAERTELVRRALLAGAPNAVAASHAGLSERSYYEYDARGQAALELADHNFDAVPDDERLFAQFSQIVREAHDEWELGRIAQIERAGMGREWKKVRTVTHDRLIDGKVVTFTTTTIEEGVDYDWKADAWLLERRNPGRWGRVTRTELSGPEGGAIPMAPMNLDAAESEAAGLVDEFTEKRNKREAAQKHQAASGQ